MHILWGLLLYLKYTLVVVAIGVVMAGGAWLYLSIKPYLERAQQMD
jgi:hypothetical protein